MTLKTNEFIFSTEETEIFTAKAGRALLMDLDLINYKTVPQLKVFDRDVLTVTAGGLTRIDFSSEVTHYEGLNDSINVAAISNLLSGAIISPTAHDGEISTSLAYEDLSSLTRRLYLGTDLVTGIITATSSKGTVGLLMVTDKLRNQPLIKLKAALYAIAFPHKYIFKTENEILRKSLILIQAHIK